jgi:hypothetical protein
VPDFTLHRLHTNRRHVSRGNDLLVSAGTIEGVMPTIEDLALVATDVSANLETTLPLRLKGTAQLDEIALQRQAGELPVVLFATGRIGDKPLTIDAAGGNLLDGDPMERDPLQATIEIGPSTSTIRGTMSRDADTHLALDITYDEPAHGTRAPLHVEARVSDPGINWRLADVRATQGDRSLTGILEIRNEGGRRLFDASVTVTNVEYPEIAEEVKGSGNDQDEKKSKRLREVLPKGDLYAHLLRGIERFDADIELRVEESRLLGVPFDWITIHTTLDRGALSANIRNSRIRESSLKGSFSITPTEDDTSVDLSAELQDADLSALIGGIERLDGVTGSFDGELSLRATGRDMPSVLGSTDGRLTLFLEHGAMPDELAQRVAGDVLTALFASFDEDDKTPIRCAIVDFEVNGGLASAQQMAMTTGEFLMFGDGRIDLNKGTIDLKFVPRAKDFSLVSMTLPFRIHGPLDEVRFNPDVSEGVASLLTPVEFGSSDELRCEPPKLAQRRD